MAMKGDGERDETKTRDNEQEVGVKDIFFIS